MNFEHLRMLAPCVLGLLCFFTTTSTHAGLIMDIRETSEHVIVTGSGTANLDGLSFDFLVGGGTFIQPSTADILIGLPSQSDRYSSVSGPTDFGTGMSRAPDFATGLRWGIVGNSLFVPIGYQSGDALEATAIWNNTTFAELGIVPGTYTWTWGSGTNADSMTLNARAATAVPESSSLALMALSCVCFFLRILFLRDLFGFGAAHRHLNRRFLSRFKLEIHP